MVVAMSLLHFLGLGHGTPAAGNEPESVRRIVAALERMDPGVARHVACFAYVLGRVAGAERGVSPEETRTGGTEDYLVTREFASSATREQRLALLDCCMAVAAADADVSIAEDDAVREIASELALSHADFIAARSAYREYLAILKNPTRG